MPFVNINSKKLLTVLSKYYLYGSGFVKTRWNPDAGEVLEVNEETGGNGNGSDFAISVPNIWNVYVDPDAESWDDVRYVSSVS